MENLKSRLLNGEEITFSNESTFSSLEISHGKTLSGSMEFKIWMNCKFIHLSKTFKSFENKLNSLIENHDLEEEF